MADVNNLYRLDGRVPIAQAIPFGLQHVLAMFVSNIAPIIILANIVGTEASISAALIQNCMVITGIGTLIQLYPIWRIGSRLPIVMGISFTFLSLSIVIATSQGMGTLMGAVVIFPSMVQTIFAENCVALVFLLAVTLDLLLPKKV